MSWGLKYSCSLILGAIWIWQWQANTAHFNECWRWKWEKDFLFIFKIITLSEKKVIIMWSLRTQWDFSIVYIELRQKIALKFHVAGFLINWNCLFQSRYKALNRQSVLHNLNSCSTFCSQSLNNEVIFYVEVEDRKKLFILSRISSACHLMRILRIHLMIYLVECRYKVKNLCPSFIILLVTICNRLALKFHWEVAHWTCKLFQFLSINHFFSYRIVESISEVTV